MCIYIYICMYVHTSTYILIYVYTDFVLFLLSVCTMFGLQFQDVGSTPTTQFNATKVLKFHIGGRYRVFPTLNPP